MDSISERINNLMKENSLSAYRLCKSCGIPQSSFSKMIRNQWDWKVDYLVRISDYFKISLEYLILGKADSSYEKLLEENKILINEVNDLNKEIRKMEAIKRILEIDK